MKQLQPIDTQAIVRIEDVKTHLICAFQSIYEGQTFDVVGIVDHPYEGQIDEKQSFAIVNTTRTIPRIVGNLFAWMDADNETAWMLQWDYNSVSHPAESAKWLQLITNDIDSFLYSLRWFTAFTWFARVWGERWLGTDDPMYQMVQIWRTQGFELAGQ